MRKRRTVFAAIVVVCAIIIVGYSVWAARRNRIDDTAWVPSDPVSLRAVLDQPHVLFRNMTLGNGYGRLSAVALSDPRGVRYTTALECERVDVAAAVGVCLTANRDVLTTYSAVVFDRTITPVHTLALTGIPSRVRLSSDGRLAGITVFETGHGYSQAGFSTRTTLVDTRAGTILADLESFTVRKDGRVFKEQDFNFWGVTFASDSNRFFATLASGAAMYLIEGNASTREALVVGRDVECPSLSPDNRWIAYKKRQVVDGRMIWRLAVLEVATGQHRILESETRNVDDQVAWLDNERVMYAISSGEQRGSTTVSVLPVDGGPPEDFLEDAYSPSLGSS